MKIKNLKEMNETNYSFFEINKNFEVNGNYRINKIGSNVEINILISKFSDEQNTSEILFTIDSDENIKNSIKRMNKILKDFNLDIKLPYPKENK